MYRDILRYACICAGGKTYSSDEMSYKLSAVGLLKEEPDPLCAGNSHSWVGKLFAGKCILGGSIFNTSSCPY